MLTQWKPLRVSRLGCLLVKRTLSLAWSNCLTTIVSARRRTWVTAARRHLAARTMDPLSAILPRIEPLPPPPLPADGLISPSVRQICESSYWSSHNFSMAAPVKNKSKRWNKLNESINHQVEYIRMTIHDDRLSRASYLSSYKPANGHLRLIVVSRKGLLWR